jgi:hypothetical protein
MAPFTGSARVSLVSGTPDDLGHINVPVEAKRGTFYEVWLERIWSRSLPTLASARIACL